MQPPRVRIGLSGCAGGLEAVSTRDLLELAEMAERLGYDGLWLNEEHFQGGSLEVEGRRCLSPLILAAAIIARTSRIRVGFSVLLLSLHHPIRLAEEIASLDVLSGGRIDLGISRGSNSRYLQAYGLARADNTQAFDEPLQLMVRAWQPGQIEVGGAEVSVEPKPIQRPHPPIYIGTYTESTAAAAACAGNRLICHGITAPEKVRRLIRAYADAGGDPADVPLGRFVYVSDSDRSAREELWPTILNLTTRLRGISRRRPALLEEAMLEPEVFYTQMVIAGAPDTCAARIEQLHDTYRTTYLNALSAFFGFLPRAELERSLELLAREVRPRLKGGSPSAGLP